VNRSNCKIEIAKCKVQNEDTRRFPEFAMPRLCRVFIVLAIATFSAIIAASEPFPVPYDSEKDKTARPLSPADAAKSFTAPAGFKVEVFAAEPDVMNPIGMSWDTRGRLWIAENFTYAERPQRFDLSLHDRVLIFEDRNGDGKPEKRTVFLDNVQRLTSVAVGLGGIWLMCPPQLLFVPDRNGDDIPDGPPEVVLDGFDIPRENYHNFANGLKWGPDGWLYGRCGTSAPGQIRRPDQPLTEAIPLAGSIWRYHPTRKVFEALASGSMNPWGHDWDANGELFFINTVGGHLWHLIPGAHYRRPHSIEPNPLAYEPIEQHADHWHWAASTKEWVEPGTLRGVNMDKYGGGHAHCGCLIYQGTQWPKEYQGKLLTLNLHGRRVNVDRLERSGSGYVGKHEPDILQSADPFFRGMDLDMGPDGSVYIIDWSDTGECHEGTGVHRNSGRIYRVTYGDVKATPTPDLTKLSLKELDEQAVHPKNVWHERSARLEELNRRDEVVASLRISNDQYGAKDIDDALRVMWLTQSLDVVGVKFPEGLLAPELQDERLRVACIRLTTDSWPLDTVNSVSRAESVNVSEPVFSKLLRMAREDKSALVRLTLASTLQRLPTKLRPELAAALLTHGEDANDHNIPFMIWYGLIPVAFKDPDALVPLAHASNIPAVRIWIARRLAEIQSTQPEHLNRLLAQTAYKSEAVRSEIVAGMSVGFAGVRKAKAPIAWKGYLHTFERTKNETVKSQIQNLNVVFGDGRALGEVRTLTLDSKADMNLRKAALKTLIEAKPDDLREICEKLVKIRYLNALALQGLTLFDDPAVGKLIASCYRNFHQSERPLVVEALVSRPTFAMELLNAIEAGVILRGDLSAAHVRQIRGFENPELTKRLTQVWGELRDSPKDKADLIAKLKTDLTLARIAAGNKSQGRAIFGNTCAACHKLFGSGGDIGPDLTGSGRKDLDYLLSNIVDPSAVVNKDFTMTVLALADGRSISGVVIAENANALTVQTAKEKVVVPKEDVEKRAQSTQSLMPDALLQPLTPEQVTDLIAYLMAEAQVELTK
jgi:putative membrane-bound dehydrogenase-like protein